MRMHHVGLCFLATIIVHNYAENGLRTIRWTEANFTASYFHQGLYENTREAA